MIILVDVDGVVADLHTEWLRRYNLDYDTDLGKEDISSWSMHKLVVPECGTKIYDYLKLPEIYDLVQPIEGALDGIKSIRKMGHRVVYLSAGFYPAKVRWLNYNGFLSGRTSNWASAEDVIIAFDKSLIKGDVLIDDRLKNVDEFHGPAILFDQPWNQEGRNGRVWRAMDWEGVVKKIERMGHD